MAMINGGELREWRRSRGWDVPELARRLGHAADEPIAAHEGLIRMIRAWERGDHRPSERYELLYRRLGMPPGNENGAEPSQHQRDARRTSNR
jgi:transcriptional regulator with XRE-family HTH domain